MPLLFPVALLLKDAVGAQRPRPAGEAGAVPVLRRRPVPGVVDGRVYWVVDAYTQTSRYPYAQRIGNDVQLTQDSGLDRDSNYVRNSVKAVVNAYDGVGDVLRQDDGRTRSSRRGRARSATCSRRASDMPEGLREHLRYPEDLFRVQTDVYSKYQLDAASSFFEREGAWSVAQAPSIDPRESTTAAPPAATTPGDQQAPSDLASESSTSRFTSRTTRCSPTRQASARTSCSCGRSSRSPRPISAPSCRRT